MGNFENMEYIQDMLNGCKRYKQLRKRLDELGEELLEEQEIFEDWYFSEGKHTCLNDSIVDIVRKEIDETEIKTR